MRGLLVKVLMVVLFLPLFVLAQEEEKEEENDIHEFEMIHSIETTPVKHQNKSGTCWAFATTSFIETELLRMGKGEHDLSEMYFVRNKLFDMGVNYIRYHGAANYGQGGQAHDVLNVIRDHGVMPEEVYDGKNYGEKIHNHSELDAVLTGILKGVKDHRGRNTTSWKSAYQNVIDEYLGYPSSEFLYNENKYSPVSLTKELGINPDDYVEISSYTHHPFYEKFNLEVPDNWSGDFYYNLPIDELMEVLNYSLENGYSVCWDGDVGSAHFYSTLGYGVVPIEDTPDIVREPETEKEITQKMRQETFDSFETTDDHLMHLTGIAKNQDDTKFYYTKNSWGTKDRKYDGYWYLSESYLRLKTMAILVHKDAIPKEIKNKLKL